MTKALKLSNAISERVWQGHVVKAAEALGWRVYHTHDSRRCTPGFPDLHLLHAKQRRIVYAELKTDKGRVRPEQQAYLEDLKACGAEVYLWRPRDWDAVIETLKGREPEG